MPASRHMPAGIEIVRAVHRVTGRNEAAAVHDPTQNVVLAKQALVQLGFPVAAADVAVRAASAHVDTDVSLEDFIRAALRNCR